MAREPKEEKIIDLGVMKVGQKLYAGIVCYAVTTYYIDDYYANNPEREQSRVFIGSSEPRLFTNNLYNADVVWPLSLIDKRRGLSVDDAIKRVFDKWRPHVQAVRDLQVDVMWERINREYNVFPEKHNLTTDGYVEVKKNG